MAEIDHSKRALFSKLSASAKTEQTSYVRPPNALPEVEFLRHCSQCSRCISACPNNAIALEQNYPVLTGKCDRCNQCVQACPSGALSQQNLKAQVSFRCNPKLARFCQTCAEHCPHGAITINAGEHARINSSLCSGCGKCVDACDFFAISLANFNAPH